MQVRALRPRIKIVKTLHLFSQPLPADWPVSSRNQQVTAMAMRRDGLPCQESWSHGPLPPRRPDFTDIEQDPAPSPGQGTCLTVRMGTMIRATLWLDDDAVAALAEELMP